MRYWLYQDACILGPFSREDLLAQPGIGPDSLICEEGASGSAEKDWRALDALGEGVPQAALASAAPVAAGGLSGFADFQRDAHAALDGLGLGGEWNSALVGESELSDLWPPSLERPVDEQLVALRDQRTAELEERLVRLKTEFLEGQKRQKELSWELERKDRLLADREDALAELQRSLQRRRLERAEPAAAAELPPTPTLPMPEGTQAIPTVVPEAPALPSAAAPSSPEAVPPPVASVSVVPLEGAQGAASDPGPSAPPEIPVLAAAPPSLDVASDAVPALDAAPPPFDVVPALDVAPPALEAAPPPLEAAPPPLDAAPPGLSAGASLSSTLDLPPPIDFNAQLSAEPASASGAPAPVFDAPAVPSAGTPNPFEQAKTVIFSGSTGGEQAVPALQPPQLAPTNPFMPQPGAQTPLPSETGAAPQLGQPKTMLFGSPGTPTPAELEASMALTPPPAPLASGPETTTSGEIPLTVRGAAPVSSGPPSLPENLWGPRTPVPTELPGTGGKSFEDLFASPATPAPAPTGATPLPSPVTKGPSPVTEAKTVKPRGSKGFLIGLGAAALVLVLVAVFFLRDPRQVQMLFSMSPQKKRAAVEGVPPSAAGAPEAPIPARSEPSERPASPFPPQAAQGQAASAPQEGAQAYPAPAPQAAAEPAPTPGRDFIQDEGVLSLEFVKNYYLDKERGSVAQWLQYSFMSPGNEDEWVAAAVQAKVYLVTYRVFQGGRAKRGVQPITYLFEADLEKKTLVGRNPAAKDLLGPSSAGDGTAEGAKVAAELEAEQSRPRVRARPKTEAPARAKARLAKRTKTAKPAVRRAEDEQLPLPEESELEKSPASPGGSGFNNPGADPVELAP